MNNNLNIIGLILSFLGSIALARGLFITKREALRLGLPRYASDEEEENLKLPQVEERLKQRTWGIIGAVLAITGFTLQLFYLVSAN